MSMAWEIYCHQTNFRFWNHNRFVTVIIDFMVHQLSAIFHLFPGTTNWYKWLLWQVTNHLHSIDKSASMFVQCIDMFLVHTLRLSNIIYTLIKLKRAVIEMMGMNRKTSMHTPSINADLSDSMEMIFQLAKKFIIQICCVWNQNKGWQIADR